MVDVESFLQEFESTGLLSPSEQSKTCSGLHSDCSEFICSFCKKDSIYDEGGVFVCRECACVVNQPLDNSAEWRYYGIDDSKISDPNRCGLPTNPLFPNSSLGSIVGSGGGYSMHRVRKFHSWNNGNYKERSLYKVFQDILANASRHGILLTVVRESNVFYKKISENHISRGTNRTGLIAACLFMACKAMSIPRSAKEIAEIFNITTKCTIKGCKRFNEIWARIGEPPIIPKEQIRPSDFIERFCSKLNLNHDIAFEAIEICDELYTQKHVCEIAPSNVASAVLYLIIQRDSHPISKKQLCESTNTSLITVTKCYKRIANVLCFDDSTSQSNKKQNLDEENCFNRNNTEHVTITVLTGTVYIKI